MKWDKRKQARARKLIRVIADANGGFVGVGLALGQSRAVIHGWSKRGRVPPQHVKPLLNLGPPGLKAATTDLCPEAGALGDS